MDYAQYKKLEFRRAFWVVAGAKITVQDPASHAVLGFIKMKAWKLKEDIRLFTDESMQHEVFRIHARNIIDFAGTYDVIDSATAQPLFAWRRKGLKSTFVRDHWDLLDAQGAVTGSIQETSSGLALARRWVGLIPIIGEFIDLGLAFAPQTYRMTSFHAGNESLVGTITHHKNPFLVKMTLDTTEAQTPADPRIAVSATALLSTIDASKNN